VVLLQSTASVFRGHSGGMLLDRTGRFLGLVTSNAKHATGQIIPTLNFSIPSSVLRSVVACTQQAEKGELEQLQSYNEPNEVLHALWGLEGSPPPAFARKQPERVESIRKLLLSNL
jgi:S1-C subfamily serine protease